MNDIEQDYIRMLVASQLRKQFNDVDDINNDNDDRQLIITDEFCMVIVDKLQKKYSFNTIKNYLLKYYNSIM